MTQVATNMPELATTQKAPRQKSNGYQGSGKKTNDHVYEAKRAEYEKTLKTIDAEVQSLRQKINATNDEVRSLTSNDGNNSAREQLREKINFLKSEKDKIRSLKEPIFQRMNATQDQLRQKIDELQGLREKSPFKRPEDIDRKIQDMEAQVESGALKLIDEKKVIAEISKLRKLRKSVDSFSGHETVIAELKKQIESCRNFLGEKDKLIRNLDEQLKSFSSELTALSSTRSANQGKLKTLFAERDALRKKVNDLFEAKNAAYEQFQEAQKAHALWMDKDRLQREEQYVTRDIEYAVRDLEKEMRKLDIPACHEQIEQCLNLQSYLRLNVLKESVAPVSATSSAQPTTAIRQVEKVPEELVFKKDHIEDPYSMVSKKANKTTKKAPSASHHLKLPFWVISALEELKVNLVTNVEEAHAAIAALDEVKAKFETIQKEKMSSIDAEKAKIQKLIDEQKARLSNVAEEAAVRVKARQAERKASKAAVAAN